ncbi:hypothetical protein [Neptuniibacter marinus]|uniref:hypothetical protein n=1 Tax=Neptuniibacter marinus TaxID=1806670 RepID=UPI003B5BC04D
MGLFSKLFGDSSGDIEAAIKKSYSVKGFNKTQIAWNSAFKFAKSRSQFSEFYEDNDIDVDFFTHLDSEEVHVRFLRNPRNGTTVISVENAEVHRSIVRDMESGNYDPSKHPSYELKF